MTIELTKEYNELAKILGVKPVKRLRKNNDGTAAERVGLMRDRVEALNASQSDSNDELDDIIESEEKDAENVAETVSDVKKKKNKKKNGRQVILGRGGSLPSDEEFENAIEAIPGYFEDKKMTRTGVVKILIGEYDWNNESIIEMITDHFPKLLPIDDKIVQKTRRQWLRAEKRKQQQK